MLDSCVRSSCEIHIHCCQVSGCTVAFGKGCCQQTFAVNKRSLSTNRLRCPTVQINKIWTGQKVAVDKTQQLHCTVVVKNTFEASSTVNAACSWLIVSLSKPRVALMMISTLGNMKDFFVVLIFDKLWCWYFSEVSVFFPHYSERNQVWVGEWWFVYLARCFYFFLRDL